MKEELTPTLWRTCRALANRRRLALMKLVFDEGEISVTRAAEISEYPLNAVSLMLRQLQARGLLTARRDGRTVQYRPEADPLVVHARDLLTALRQTLSRPSAREKAFSDLTAFTHLRRIALAQALASGPGQARFLRSACPMSKAAFIRHMRKLIRRGFVKERDGVFRLTCPPRRLARALVSCVRRAA